MPVKAYRADGQRDMPDARLTLQKLVAILPPSWTGREERYDGREEGSRGRKGPQN